MNPPPNGPPAIERLNGGLPILSPSEVWFDSGLTFNASATYVPGDSPLLEGLTGRPAECDPDGCVALHYRARPKEDPGHYWTRSFIGLSVHTPTMDPIRRWREPVLAPGEPGPDARDDLGCEDPRVSPLDGAYWLVYCGSTRLASGAWRGSLMAARSDDLVAWEKTGFLRGTDGSRIAPGSGGFDHRYFDNMGGLRGDCERVNNKDGVLFPERFDGKVLLLHRPMAGKLAEFAVNLAMADEPTGPYEDLGPIIRAPSNPAFQESWAGGGGTPIPLGHNRWLMIGHTGNYRRDGSRYYVLDAFLLDLDRFDRMNPSAIVRGRLDGFLRPETDFEIHGPSPDSVGNVVFSCGNFVRDGWLTIVYGGGDSYTLAARVRLEELVGVLEASPVSSGL